MSWRSQAACLGADPDIFFLAKGDSQTGKLREARAYCKSCPVQIECLTYACQLKLGYGVYGGTTYNQRRKLWQDAP